MARPGPLRLVAMLAAACHQAPADTGPGDADAAVETACAEAEARLGYPACEHRVPDEAAFEALTVLDGTADAVRVGKYLVPAVPDARLPGLFIYVDVFPLHYDFLLAAFPDDFAGLTTDRYEQLILYPETREFYAGTWGLYADADGSWRYGFTVWDDPADPSSTVTEAQVAAAWEELQARFDLGDLAFVPGTSAQREAAAGWEDAPFDVMDLAEVRYEAYNPGEAWGTLRLYTLDEFEAATEDAAYGWQDIVVIEEAPTDVERVVSAIVTGTRQGALSHLNVRSASRGTPNCFIADPLDALADWADTLVHLTCGEADWSVEAGDEADAWDWWDALRPDPVEVCAPDTTTPDMPDLLEAPVATAEERAAAVCVWGSKGTNLATLYQLPDVVDEEHRYRGFLVPMSAYRAFVEDHGWTVDLGDGEAEHSFAETLDAWNADATFLSDPALRRERLLALQDAMRTAEVDPDLVEAVTSRIVETWGSDEVMVRFRSSSNAEDALGFSGAGLYESESACAADETDGDSRGPSRCDPDKDDERTVSDALRTVWASLWNPEAWEERDWYGIDQDRVAMGILVNDRAEDEQASAVAFSGNPGAEGDDRYLVNAQAGEVSVVSTDPGVWPESELLTVEDGAVVDITRVATSSEADEVLSDAELAELGGLLWAVAAAFPVDETVPEGRDLLWDTEWKVLSDGRLVIKQIRPYLR